MKHTLFENNDLSETGMFARAKAGHDKGQLYVIIRKENEYVYLTDGRIRTVEKPKRKNRKHVQIIKSKIDNDVLQRLLTGTRVRNEEIKRAIKLYERNQA